MVRSESEFVFVSGFVSEPVPGPEFGFGSGSGCMVLSLSDGIIKLRPSLQSKYFLRYFFTIARRLFREIVRIPCSLVFCWVGGGLIVVVDVVVGCLLLSIVLRLCCLLQGCGVWLYFSVRCCWGRRAFSLRKFLLRTWGLDVVTKACEMCRALIACASGP